MGRIRNFFLLEDKGFQKSENSPYFLMDILDRNTKVFFIMFSHSHKGTIFLP